MGIVNLFNKEESVTALAKETATDAWALLRYGKVVAEIKKSGNSWLLLSGSVCMVFSRLTDLFMKVEEI